MPVTNGTIALGENVTVLDNVTNTGPAVASGFTATFGIRLTGTGSPTFTSIGATRSFGGLAPSAVRPVGVNWTVNSSVLGDHLPPANAEIVVNVAWAPGNGVSNASLPIVVVPTPRPDLTENVLTAWSDTPTPQSLITNDTIAVGENITVLDNVTNTGTATATGVNVTFGVVVISTGNSTFKQIGPARSVGGLAPLAVTPVQFNWTVNGTIVGIHPGPTAADLVVPSVVGPRGGSDQRLGPRDGRSAVPRRSPNAPLGARAAPHVATP